MTWPPPQLAQQTGRTFVVTGANSGIGLETARALVGRGAHVVLAVRDTAKGEKAAAHLVGPGSTSVGELDLSDLDQVADCAKTLLDRHDDLAGLICNAGVMGGPFLLTRQGFRGADGHQPPGSRRARRRSAVHQSSAVLALLAYTRSTSTPRTPYARSCTGSSVSSPRLPPQAAQPKRSPLRAHNAHRS